MKKDLSKAKKGRGWHGDAAAHARVGRLGGKATAQEYGDSSFYHVENIS